MPILRLKLQHWFPQYEQRWLQAVPKCQQQLTNYLTNNRTSCRSPCACAADCFLEDITGTIQSNFASAQVLLGLIPTILVQFGPTIAEMAVLSTYQPFLTVLLAFGSPAVHVTRLFGNQVDIREPLTRPVPRILEVFAGWLEDGHGCQAGAGPPARMWHRNSVFRYVFRVLSYVAALAAIANNVHNSVNLDLRTISGWRCAALLMPFYWSLSAVVVHAFGMLSVRCRVRTSGTATSSAHRRPQAFRELADTSDGVLSELFLWLASLCAIASLVFGTLDLSSLVFISAIEALEVFFRYAASAALCQLVVMVELARLRQELVQVNPPNTLPPAPGSKMQVRNKNRS